MPRYELLSRATLIGNVFDRGGDEFLCGHLKTAVAIHGPHAAVGFADLGAYSSGYRKAHRAQPTRVDPGVGVVELPILAGVHLMLTNT